MSLFGLYLHKCRRHERKYRAIQASDSINYVLGMCSSHGTVESTQCCQGERSWGHNNRTQYTVFARSDATATKSFTEVTNWVIEDRCPVSFY